MRFNQLPSISLLPAIVCLLMICQFAAANKTGKRLPPISSTNFHDTIPVSDSMVDGGGIFQKVEIEAYFPGGEPGWRSYLVQNLNPNVPVDKGAPVGTYTIWIQFVVDVDGRLSDFKALTKFGYGMEAEVLRILRKSPPWVPAVQDGHNVRAYRKQPVTFQIEFEGKKKKKRS
jgi:hypothetical protein